MSYVQEYNNLTCKSCGSHLFQVDPKTGVPGCCAQCHRNFAPSTLDEKKIIDNITEQYKAKLEKKLHPESPICGNCGAQRWQLAINNQSGEPVIDIGHCYGCGMNYTGAQDEQTKEAVCSATYNMSLADYVARKMASLGKSKKQTAEHMQSNDYGETLENEQAKAIAQRQKEYTDQLLGSEPKVESPDEEAPEADAEEPEVEEKPEIVEKVEPKKTTRKKATRKKAAKKTAPKQEE